MECLSCGHSITPGDERCSQCGTPIPASVSGSSSASRWGEEETILDSASTRPRSDSVDTPEVPRSEPLRPGQLVGDQGEAGDGRYEVLRELARGGMGVVYLARDRRFAERLGGVNRRVVVKRILDPGDTGIERFLRETRAVSSLEHENIVSIHDFGQDAQGPYIVMGYVEGGTLKTLVSSEGPMEDDAFYELARGLARALDYVHEHKILHRDVKPSNVLMTREGLPKLSDFGLVRIGDDSDLSTTGHGMGTAAYAAPEQKRGDKYVDQRADLFGLGATLYYAVTGESPRTIRESRLPDRWRELVMRCVEEDAERRFESAHHFLEALEDARDDTNTGTGDLREGVLCANCNAYNRAGESYCRQCGAGLFRHCPSCTVSGEVSVRFCVHCGLDIDNWLESEEHLIEAQRLLEEARYEDAIAAGHRAEAAYGGRAEVKETVSLAKRRRTALLNAWDKAEADDRAERYEQARRSWHRVLHYDPENKRARAALASTDTHIRQRDLRRAMQHLREACEQESWPGAKEAMDHVLRLAQPDDSRQVVEVEETYAEFEARARNARDEFERSFRVGDRGGAAEQLEYLERIEYELPARAALRRQLKYLDSHQLLGEQLAAHDWKGARRAWNELARSAPEEQSSEVEALRIAVADLREELLRRTYEEFRRSIRKRDFEAAEEVLLGVADLQGDSRKVSGYEQLLAHRKRKRLWAQARVAGLQGAILLALVAALSLWVVGLHEERLRERCWEALSLGDVEEAKECLTQSWTDSGWAWLEPVVGTPLRAIEARVAFLEDLEKASPTWVSLQRGSLAPDVSEAELLDRLGGDLLFGGKFSLLGLDFAGAKEHAWRLQQLPFELGEELQTEISGYGDLVAALTLVFEPELAEGEEEQEVPVTIEELVGPLVSAETPEESLLIANDLAGLSVEKLRSEILRVGNELIDAARDAGDEHEMIRLRNSLGRQSTMQFDYDILKRYRKEVGQAELAVLAERLDSEAYDAILTGNPLSELFMPGAISTYREDLVDLLRKLASKPLSQLTGSEVSQLQRELSDFGQVELPDEFFIPAIQEAVESFEGRVSAEGQARLDAVLTQLEKKLAERGTLPSRFEVELASDYELAGFELESVEDYAPTCELLNVGDGKYQLAIRGLQDGESSLRVSVLPRTKGVLPAVKELTFLVDASSPLLLASIWSTPERTGGPASLVVELSEEVELAGVTTHTTQRLDPEGVWQDVELDPGQPTVEELKAGSFQVTWEHSPSSYPGQANARLRWGVRVRDRLGNESRETLFSDDVRIPSARYAEADWLASEGGGQDWFAALKLLEADLKVERPQLPLLGLTARAVRAAVDQAPEATSRLRAPAVREAETPEAALQALQAFQAELQEIEHWSEGLGFELLRAKQPDGVATDAWVREFFEASAEAATEMELESIARLRRDLDELRMVTQRALREAERLQELLEDPQLEQVDALETESLLKSLEELEYVQAPAALQRWGEGVLLLFQAVPDGMEWSLRVPGQGPWTVWESKDVLPLPRVVRYGPGEGVDFVLVPQPEAGSFYIARTEVSVRTYHSFQSTFESEKLLYPQVGLTWLDVDLWCREGDMRLPTMQEWLLAAQAPSWSKGSWRSGVALNSELPAVYPVGVGPTPEEASDETWCGALDMGANAREWCFDRIEEEGSVERRVMGWSYRHREGENPWDSRSLLPESQAAADIGWRPVLNLSLDRLHKLVEEGR